MSVWASHKGPKSGWLPDESLDPLPTEFPLYWLALQPKRKGSLSNPLLASQIPACFRVGGKNGIFCLVAMLCHWRNSCIDKKTQEDLSSWDRIARDVIAVFRTVHDSII